MTTKPTDPDPTIGTPLRIVPLEPGRLPDLLGFFDREAFVDNPEWASCYCQCYLEDHAVVRWDDRTGVENRALAERRVHDDTMRGLLAYRGDRLVGWCHAGPRALFHVLDREPLADAAEVGTILCFIVAPTARGQGVARALLDAACEQLAAVGCRYAEANPRSAAVGPAANHHGPIGMFLRAGFTIRTTEGDGSAWVRKDLRPSASSDADPG